jgi:signal transduction histidine kinase
MENGRLRILLVDDDEDYYVLVRDLLRDAASDRYHVEWVDDWADGLSAMLSQSFDVCLLDHDLGQDTGLALMQAARQAGCRAPILMLTGHGGYEVDLAAMRAGAADYVAKVGLSAVGLERAIRYAVERARALETLHERERLIAELYEQEQHRRRELELVNEELRRSEAHRDELVHMIVHDLRNPLTAIIGNLGRIDRTTQAARADSLSHLLVRTKINASRILDMIDEMLAVSRLEAGVLHPNLCPVNLSTLLADKVADYRPQVEEANKTLREHVPPNLPIIQADISLIGRVIDNLVTNALKFTPAGGCISVSANGQEQAVIVAIGDNGPGIPAEYQTRIFEKYYQVPAEGASSTRKGAGIGLTFCQLAVALHHGHIWVESTAELGSVFSFSLPIGP